MGIVDNALMGASGQGGYFLTRSLRFRSSASAYLNRTPASAGNRQTWTWSAWVKRGTLGTRQVLFSCNAAGNDSQRFFIEFGNSSDDLSITAFTQVWRTTTQVFRDPSAWYHIVVNIDTTQATASNRIKLYINGAQVTAFAASNDPSLNANLGINQASAHSIGQSTASSFYLDGYLTEVNFIDGQALTPSSFGETDTITGVWKPKAYSGTYGTNGFELQFTDNSAATAAAIGKDSSGNGNNWTPNNISITAGVTYDSMTDVPTLTSATAANFAVMNVLNGNPATGSLSDGNLTGLSSSAGEGYWNSTIAIPSSGKWYWEFQFTTGGSGIRTAVTTTSMGTYSLLLNESGRLYVNGADQGIVASGYSGTDIMGVSVDVSTTTIKWYKNNTLNYTYTYTAQSLPLFAFGGKYSNPCYFNFGQRPFAYTPPTGFVALNTFNLPTSTIVKGNTVMDATLYTGNGSTQTITNAAAFKPDLVWAKARSSASWWHILVDSVRGVGRTLSSNVTNAEIGSGTDLIPAINSNGFNVNVSPNATVNENATTYVGWQWQAGQGTNTTNTNGTITSTVSVNASAGFSVTTFTGTGAAGITVGHGLGVAPAFFIVKSRGTTGNWLVYHQLLGNTGGVALEQTAAFTANAGYWNNTSPTSSVFTLGTFTPATTCVAYCWTPIAGYSAFGSYTGNGSTDGPFTYVGFRPKWVMWKRTDVAGTDWIVEDTSRSTYNQIDARLFPNTSDAEISNGNGNIDFLSNGFKLRNSHTGMNASGGTYIYMAFAETPTKFALAR